MSPQPVPLEEMYRRIDKLAELGTTLVTISGGETAAPSATGRHHPPHPQHGIIAGLITNGYLLTAATHPSNSMTLGSTTCRSPSTT